jgi:hypothetical protein
MSHHSKQDAETEPRIPSDPGMRERGCRSETRLPDRSVTAEKVLRVVVGLRLGWRVEFGWMAVLAPVPRVRLGGLGPEGGSDWVEVDQDGGPGGL